MKFSVIRADASNPDFINLVARLDAELAARDGRDHTFYDQFNRIDGIRYALVAFDKDKPVGCGALKEFDAHTMEVKRMFVDPAFRGLGIAVAVLSELETWAKELGYDRCVLETGKRQPEAIRLYEKQSYQRIPNYGQYVGVENSVCFEKIL